MRNSRVAPASSAQQRMYFASVMKPDSSADSRGTVLAVSGDFAVDKLDNALKILRGRHDVLRATFMERDGEVVQVVPDDDNDAPQPALIQFAEAQGDTHDERSEWAYVEARRLAGIPLSIPSGITWRVDVIRISAELHLVVLAFHHIITDATSMRIFAEELRLAYADPGATVFDSLPAQYSDFCQLENGSTVDSVGLEYWRGQLADVPTTRFPEDGEGGPRGITGARLPLALTEELAEEFETFCKDRSVTPFTGFLAVYFILLGRWSGARDITVGTQVLNRPSSSFFQTIGFFSNTAVLRCQVAPAASFDQFLESVNETVLDVLEYQDVPFEVVVDELAPYRDADRNPLFQVAIDYDPEDQSELWVLDGLQVTPVFELAGLQFDLTLEFKRQAGKSVIAVEYDRQRFSDSAMRQFADAYGKMLRAVMRAPHVPLGSIPVLDPGELAETLMLGSGGAAQSDLPAECTSAWDLFELTARTVPEREALRTEEEQLTFAELAGRSRSMAGGLQARGVETGAVVGICLPRRSDLIVAMLAVWCAGGAFLLLDPEQPESRRRSLLQKAGAALLVMDDSFAGIETVSAAGLRADASSATATATATRRPASAPAYVLFTSGSTGEPKGVVIDQAGLVAHAGTQLPPMYGRLADGPQLNVGALSALTFDAFINQCLGMMAFGHRLLLISDEERMDLPRLLARGSAPESAIEVLDATSSQMEILVEAGLLALPHPPKVLVIGGESASDGLWRSLRDQPGLRAFITYGCTETTVESTIAEIREHPRQVAGRAAGTSRIYIVDDQLNLLPPLFVGEVCIGGVGVAQGYVGQPAYTSERFIADPFSTVPGQRMYRTGDKGRLRPDGQLEFWGRIDDQVKVRGLRVQPGEIEAALLGHSAIARAVVLATDAGTHLAQLVAYLVPEDGGRDSLTFAGVREFLRGKLPSALLPDRVEVLDEFPITPNGKLDRRALSGMKAPTAEPTAEPSTEPGAERRTGTAAGLSSRESQLCQIVGEIVGAPQVGLDDNFFALGGNSLLAMQVTSRVHSTMGCELGVRAIFDTQSIGELAARLTAGDGGHRPALRPALRKRGNS